MVMLRPQSPASNLPARAPGGGCDAARGNGSTPRFRTLFSLSIRRISVSPLAAAAHEHSADDLPDSHDHRGESGGGTHGASGDRWAELRFGPASPRGPVDPLPPTDRGRRLNLLLSWGGWQNESWVDRLPALLEPMGVHSLRVRTAREAERAIRTNPVHIAVVDLGLPLDASSSSPAPASEEAGPRVLELLRRLESPPPTVVVQQARSARDANRHMSAALRCDAFAVVDRAAADVELMLKVLQRCMQRFYHGRWPGSL